MAAGPTFLARGPWEPRDVSYRWAEAPYRPSPTEARAADEAIRGLRARDSPSHDGLGARLADHRVDPDGHLHLELEPARWALRLPPGDAARSMTGQCVVRDEEGRWLAGRRASWVATWPQRWTLGAGGAVDLGESPMHTLERELDEEWGVRPRTLRGEALLLLPNDMVMLVGVARVASGTEVRRDPEHDAHDWWPADVERWPERAGAPLRALARMVAEAGG